MIRNKILLVAHSYPSQRLGGVELYTHRLAKEFLKQEQDVSVLYPLETKGLANPEISQEEYENIATYILKRDSLSEFIFNQSNLAMEQCFDDFLIKHKFDVIHFHHTINMPVSFIAVAKKHCKKVILTIHDFWFMYPRPHLYDYSGRKLIEQPMDIEYALKDLFGNKLDGASEDQIASYRTAISIRQESFKKILKYPDLITVPSEFVLNLYKKEELLTDDAQVINPGILSLEADGINGIISRDSIVFGYIGGINELKNIYSLVEAFKRVERKVELHIWGAAAGQHLENLNELIKDDLKIKYFGEYDLSQLGQILNSFDCVVIPSVIESFCFTVREALSLNKPVIASNVGGIVEVIEDGVNGLLFNPLSVEDIAASITKIAEDPSLIAKLQANIKQVKTIDLDAQDWITLYNTLKPKPDKSNSFGIGDIDLTEHINLNPQLKDHLEKINFYLAKGKKRLALRIIKEYFSDIQDYEKILKIVEES